MLPFLRSSIMMVQRFSTHVCVIGCIAVIGAHEGASVRSVAQTALLRPAPLRFEPQVIRGEAKIPDGVAFGMECDLDGVLMIGDWKAIGRVTHVDHKAGLIQFDTEEFRVNDEVRQKSQRGRLAYRLPHGLKLPLAAGDPITLLHDHDTNEKRLEWDIHIASGEELIFATTHQHDDSPPRSAETAEVLFEGAAGGHVVFFWSDPTDDDLNQSLTTVRRRPPPLRLRVADGDGFEEVSHDSHLTSITLRDKKYFFFVNSSEYYENQAHEHDPAEKPAASHSHSIECVLIKATR